MILALLCLACNKGAITTLFYSIKFGSQNQRKVKYMPQKLIVFDRDRKVIFLPLEVHGGYDALPPSFRNPDVSLPPEGSKPAVDVPATRKPAQSVIVPPGISVVTYAQFGRALEPTYAYEIYKYFLDFFYIPTQNKITPLSELNDAQGFPVDVVQYFSMHSSPIEDLVLTPLRFSDVSTSSLGGINLIKYYKYIYEDIFEADLKKIIKRRTAQFNFDYFKYFGLTLNHFFQFAPLEAQQVPLSLLLSRVLNIFGSKIADGWSIEIHLFACRSAIGESYALRRPGTRGRYDLSDYFGRFENSLCQKDPFFRDNYLFFNESLKRKNKTLVCDLSPPVRPSMVSISPTILFVQGQHVQPSLNVFPPTTAQATTLRELDSNTLSRLVSDTELPPHEFFYPSSVDELPPHAFLDDMPPSGPFSSSSTPSSSSPAFRDELFEPGDLHASPTSTTPLVSSARPNFPLIPPILMGTVRDVDRNISYQNLLLACHNTLDELGKALDILNTSGKLDVSSSQKEIDKILKLKFYFLRITTGLRRIIELIETVETSSINTKNSEIDVEINKIEAYFQYIYELSYIKATARSFFMLRDLWEKFYGHGLLAQ